MAAATDNTDNTDNTDGEGLTDDSLISALANIASAPENELEDLAAVLTAAGLNERAVCSCFGVSSAVQAPLRAGRLSPPAPMPPAALIPWLLCAGRRVSLAGARTRIGGHVDTLCGLGIATIAGKMLRPRVRLLPLGTSFVCCGDAADRPGDGAAPDDSSAHLLGCLPRRRVRRWLDIGTGSATAPLAARGLADRTVGSELDERALACARAGARLSGIAEAELELVRSDLFESLPATSWDLITFNAPIPSEHPGGEALLERFWNQVEAHLAPGGEVLVHSVLDRAGPRKQANPRGRSVTVRYTPQSCTPPFGVTLLRPNGPDRHEQRSISLTREKPHVTRDQLC